MEKLKAVIVEDEEVSRDILKNYLSKYCADVEFMGAASNIEEGKILIESSKPNIVFLDIEMPYGNGFDLLEQLEDISFDVVFITAYSHYAIKALNLSASYYILKPIDIDELVNAVDKIKKEQTTKQQHQKTKILTENIKSLNNKSKKIVLPQLDGFKVVKISNIIRAEASDNYTVIYLEGGEKQVISKTLKHFEELLCDMGFLRSHKSHLINLDHIAQYKKGKVGQVIMSDNSIALVSSNAKKELSNYFL